MAWLATDGIGQNSKCNRLRWKGTLGNMIQMAWRSRQKHSITDKESRASCHLLNHHGKRRRHLLMPSEPDHICKPCMKHFGNTKTGIWRFEHSKGWFLVNLTGPSPGYKWVNQPRSIDVTVSRLRTFARRSPCRVSSCARLPIWDTQQFRKMLFSKQTYKYIHDYIWL